MKNILASKLPWEETYKCMAQENEDWGDFAAALHDGLTDETAEWTENGYE